MKRYFFILFLLLFSFQETLPVLQTIDVSQRYTWGTDVSYIPAFSNDAIIQITVSNVIVDFQNHNFSQDPSSLAFTGLSAIVVSPNLSNITLKNATIANITGTGIIIGAGCSQITIENITTLSCDLCAIDLEGVAGNQISNSEISNCLISSCCQGSAGNYPLSIVQCNQTNVDNCRFYNNGNSLNQISVIKMDTYSQGVIQNIIASSNIGGQSLITFDFANAVQQVILQNCKIFSSAATLPSSTTIGYEVRNSATTSTNNIVQNCIMMNSQPSATNGTVTGFDLNNAQNFLISNCKFQNNQAQSNINGFSLSSGSFNYIEDCQVSNNICTGNGSFTGFNANAVSTCKLAECTIFNNQSTNANAFGINLTSCNLTDLSLCTAQNITTTNGQSIGIQLLTCTNCSAKDCTTLRNSGQNANSSFGFNVVGGSGNIFIKNSSMGNGSNPGNHFYGLNQNNTAAGPGTNTNGNANPWTNFGITG